MILDTVKRILGIGGNPTRQETENQPGTSPGLNGQLFPHRQVVPPEITQIESEMAQIHKFMEQQMRSMIGSFGFSFGGPFSGFGFEDSANGQFPPFSFTPQVPQIPFNPGDPEVDNVPLNPRDEVLKPQFRSRPSGLWNGQDQILDNRVNTEGIDAVMDELSPPSERQDGSLMGNFSQFFGNGLFSGSIFENDTFGRSFSQENGFSVSSSTVTTIYSNVNGYKSVEKIVRHPDGKVERTVITDNINPEQR